MNQIPIELRFWSELASGRAQNLDREEPGHIAGRIEMIPHLAQLWKQNARFISQERFEALFDPSLNAINISFCANLAFWHSALQQARLSPYARAVYTDLVMRDNGKEGGHAFPSILRIADSCGISPRSVIRAVKELERKGLIEVTRTFGKSSQYRVRTLEQWNAWQCDFRRDLVRDNLLSELETKLTGIGKLPDDFVAYCVACEAIDKEIPFHELEPELIDYTLTNWATVKQRLIGYTNALQTPVTDMHWLKDGITGALQSPDHATKVTTPVTGVQSKEIPVKKSQKRDPLRAHARARENELFADFRNSRKSKRNQLPSIFEVIECCAKHGLPKSDAEYLHAHWQANGFTIGGRPVKSWRAQVASWKIARHFPSQKSGGSSHKGQSPL